MPTGATSLARDSIIDITQIATVDRESLEERIGTLPDWLMAQADAGLARALALTHR